MSSIQIQNNVNTQKQQVDKTSLPKLALGLAGGAAAGFATSTASSILTESLSHIYLKNADKFYASDNNILLAEANRMIDESGIAKKGFKDITLVKLPIFWFIEEAIPKTGVKFSDIIHSIIKKPEPKNINSHTQNIREHEFINQDKISVKEACQKVYKDYLDSVANGSIGTKSIAFFEAITDPLKYSNYLIGQTVSAKSKIMSAVTSGVFGLTANNIISGSPNSLLHEVGHAINRNKSFLTRIPQFSMLLSIKMLMPLVIINAAFTKRHKNNEENNDKNTSLFTKTREFTRKHLGLTIAGLWTPILIEEAAASLRAISFVNKSEKMGEKLKHQHNKCLKIAYGTYLVGAISSILTVKSAIFIKDKIIEHKPKDKK